MTTKTTTATQESPSAKTNTSMMKGIRVHEFVSNFETMKQQDAMTFHTDLPKPSTLKDDQLLIRVLACSISPGDVIMVHGNLIFMHASFPFVPGMDVCGLVEDANGSDSFKKGDMVVAANGMSPVGGMAEYMAVSKEEVVLKPDKVDVLQAAASSSAITARNAVLDHVRPGDRVLILGGSGGVGSAAIQLAKHHAKASFVATTSSQTEFCKSIGADQVINYKNENWWEMEPWGGESKNMKFDKIIDTVGGGNFYGKAERVLKSSKQGGEFVAVCGDDPKPDCRTVWKAVKFFARLPWRPLYTWMRSSRLPKYVLLMPYDNPKGRKQVLDWMQDDSLKVVLDERSPLPFSEDGVQEAFRIVASGHAHGKVVVSMTAAAATKDKK